MTNEIVTSSFGPVMNDFSNPQQACSAWLGRTWRELTSQFSIDRAAGVALAAGIVLGGFMAISADNSQDRWEGVLFAGASTSLTCFAWALGCAAKGEKAKAARCFMIALATGAAVMHEYNKITVEKNLASLGDEEKLKLIHLQPDSIEERMADKLEEFQLRSLSFRHRVKEVLRSGGK